MTITKFADPSNPGWVELELVDAHGRVWTFLEKVPVVSAEDLDETSDYPHNVLIPGEVIARRKQGEHEVVLVDFERPWGIFVRDELQTTQFELLAEQLHPWDAVE